MQNDDQEIITNRGWLPTWWMLLFYGSIVFSIGYVVYMHGIAGWSTTRQYKEEVADFDKNFPSQTAKLNDDGSNPFRGDAAAVAAGQKTFDGLCAACHKVDMTGLVGPNLIDATWLHGATDREVYQVILEGVPIEKALQNPARGAMPAHKTSLGSKKILEVMAYVASKNPTLRVK
ncbi:MAG: c-type cytochrome [Spirochaetia bacterium]|nr:c-type cytochrome [Spirochaetia bacterium]